MYKRAKSFVYDAVSIVITKRVNIAAAALGYYLTMTIFPLVICLYTMLGTQYKQALAALGILEEFMMADTVSTLVDFINYVAANNNRAMLIAALAVLVTSSSAAFRTFEIAVGDMQGQRRFRGFFGMVFSMVSSLVFLAAIFASILIMMTGSWFIELLTKWLPFATIDTSWTWFRFIILFGLIFLLIWAFYKITVPPKQKYNVTVGALCSAVALVGVCIAFSAVIGASSKYPLVYGSLASIILLMFWLYVCSYVLLIGEVINVVIRDRKWRRIAQESIDDNNDTHD